ncbi:MAG: thioredoxin family protein [Thermogutta sp.]|nr:thioredoxin family protein [Thermogutta sp.]HOP76642.1 thioredoxin family protein [Thermogutta sp.]HPU07381.1 thioredoxin family protein [Thermogutta sp.]
MRAALVVAIVLLGMNPIGRGSEPVSYSEQFAYSAAYRQSLETQQPFLVIVGAQWCPACRKLESEVIPKIKEMGLTKQVAFAVVDYDAETKVAQQLTRGGPIPQVLVFRRGEQGWKSDRLVGYPSQKAVISFIQAALSSKDQAPAGQQASNN